MNEYEVWMEGYGATGESGNHRLIGKFRADTFTDACRIAAMHLADGNPETYAKYYNEETNCWWGCGFFDNEEASTKMDA